MDAEETTPAPVAASPGWFSKFSSVVFVIFCFEIGLFLLIYPWLDAWTDNTISLLGRGEYLLPWQRMWNNPYFRGAISGAGVLNLWIALVELFSLFRKNS